MSQGYRRSAFGSALSHGFSKELISEVVARCHKLFINRHSTNPEGLRSFSNEKPDFWANHDKIKIPTDACVVNA